MIIFDKFLRQNLIKIYAKTHQIAPFHEFLLGHHDPKPASTSVKKWPPLPNPGYDPVIHVYTGGFMIHL